MILFLLPRIHQNIVSEFLELSHKQKKFKIICLNTSLNDFKFKPYIIKPFPILSFLSRLILGNLPNKGYVIPSFNSLIYIFKSIKNSKVVILREVRFPTTFFSLAIILIFQKEVILRIQHPYKNLPVSYCVLKKIFKLFKIKIKIHNALPFSSSEIIFKPFKRPFVPLKPAKIDNNSSNISITTIGKLEHRKKLFFPLLVAKELAKKDFFDSININLFMTYKDIESERILRKLKSNAKILKKKLPQISINFNIQVNNKEVLDGLTKSHIYLHPAENEPASYSIIEAFSSGAYVISQDNCFTTDYLPYENCGKKFTEFTPLNISNYIVENFAVISNKKNRVFRTNANFVER